MAQKYNPKKIERKWQAFWEKKGFFLAKDFSKKEKFYSLIEFPYPSGEGLHVGHVRSYVAMDVVSRKKRLQGLNVLYPIGWDAFGLPAENYAIKTGTHPSITVKKNISVFKRQLKSLGISFDWSREINTTDSEYYKWTQWIFLQLFKNGLAYQAKMPINWCPSCKIGLANEEVVNGNCERCGRLVEKKELKQWLLRITKYADRLIEDLKGVDYLEKIKVQQINWIGKSSGIEVDFKIDNSNEKIKVFTTRIDTIFGVMAVVLAPENNLVSKITKQEFREKVEQYVKESKQKSDFERTKLEKDKTGVFSGSYCLNPVSGEKIPIWIGDYVISSYGGGAVMMVPAHDKRDYDFAKKHNIEIREVISGGDILKDAFVDYGKLVNSGEFSGLLSLQAIDKICAFLELRNLGRKITQYKLRDWIFSRQHYWGEPIPIIHCEKCGTVPVKEKELPVKLPFVKNYQPTGTGESPLAKIVSWVNTKCPNCKGQAKRETDTMPNWAGSSWYFLRYIDSKNNKAFAQDKKLKYWIPVNWYNGGMEHTTLHLLYSRFWYKFLYDIKAVFGKEPYQKRTSHGVILGPDGEKMSKSKGNVISPDEIVKEYGADTLRVYEMFMGPFDQQISWSKESIRGVNRFLIRLWDLVFLCKDNKKSGIEVEKEINKLIKKVEQDIELVKFNTAIAAFMSFVNFCYNNKEKVGKDSILKLLVIFSPFAPHITEELFSFISKKSINLQTWPKYDKSLIIEERANIVVQINGKFRDQFEIEKGLGENEVKNITFSREKIKKRIQGEEIRKVVFIKDKIINIVI